MNRAKKDQDANLAVAHTWSEFNTMLDKQKVCVDLDLDLGGGGRGGRPLPPFGFFYRIFVTNRLSSSGIVQSAQGYS